MPWIFRGEGVLYLSFQIINNEACNGEINYYNYNYLVKTVITNLVLKAGVKIYITPQKW